MKAWRLQFSSMEREHGLQQLWRLNSQRTVRSFQGTAAPPPPICSVPGRLLDSSQLLIGNDSTASRAERLSTCKTLQQYQKSHSGVKRLTIHRINFAHFIYEEKIKFFRLKIVFMSLFFSFCELFPFDFILTSLLCFIWVKSELLPKHKKLF